MAVDKDQTGATVPSQKGATFKECFRAKGLSIGGVNGASNCNLSSNGSEGWEEASY